MNIQTNFESSDEGLCIELDVKYISAIEGKPYSLLERLFHKIFDTKWKRKQIIDKERLYWKNQSLINDFWNIESNYDIGFLEYDYNTIQFAYLFSSELEKQGD
ncbi:MAG: hypothetical protein K5790_10150 [Nitrosopumilus sp.]|uniref:hypothetical protein n=1 Tax=Nitrosopumilus sp. TaxID=2024843 RepID=UPI00247DC526|nr:hypothetical protein [Nitrosopumilus sp.]MCV0393630.1 hypothetical protein [Nitrosopumilus sp.]